MAEESFKLIRPDPEHEMPAEAVEVIRLILEIKRGQEIFLPPSQKNDHFSGQTKKIHFLTRPRASVNPLKELFLRCTFFLKQVRRSL